MSFCDDIRALLREKELNTASLAHSLALEETTVRQWEDGSALPDAASLSQLRELFPDVDLPLELYGFSMEEEEVKKAFKWNIKRYIKHHVKFILSFVVLAIIFKFVFPSFLYGFIAIVFLYLVIVLAPLAQISKNNKKTLETYRKTRYELSIRPDYLSISGWEGSRRCSETPFHYEDVVSCYKAEGFLMPFLDNRYFLLPLKQLTEDSLLHRALNPKAVKERSSMKNAAPKSLRVISIVLLILSILCLPAGLIIAALIFYIPFFSGMLPLLPVAIILFGSMFFGLVLLILQKREGRKNLYASAIVIFMLCLFVGSAEPAYSYGYHDPQAPAIEEIMEKSEDALDMDLPTPSDYDSYSYNDYADNDCFVYYYSYIACSFKEAAAFERSMDKRWLDRVPGSLKGICEDIGVLQDYDSFIFLNMDTGEMNTAPEESGEYRFMAFYYNHRHNELYIVEYDLDYLK